MALIQTVDLTSCAALDKTIGEENALEYTGIIIGHGHIP